MELSINYTIYFILLIINSLEFKHKKTEGISFGLYIIYTVIKTYNQQKVGKHCF